MHIEQIIKEVAILVCKFFALYGAYDFSNTFVLKKIIGNKGKVRLKQQIWFCSVVVVVASLTTLILFRELKNSNELVGLTITVSFAAVMGVLEAYRLNKTFSDKERAEKTFDLFRKVDLHSDDRD